MSASATKCQILFNVVFKLQAWLHFQAPECRARICFTFLALATNPVKVRRNAKTAHNSFTVLTCRSFGMDALATLASELSAKQV
jgi:hypothetical protein